jgi:hypothetical protein
MANTKKKRLMRIAEPMSRLRLTITKKKAMNRILTRESTPWRNPFLEVDSHCQ